MIVCNNGIRLILSNCPIISKQFNCWKGIQVIRWIND